MTRERASFSIEMVRKNEVPIDEYVIRTQLKRRIEKYASQGPHVRAAKRLQESGEKVGKGSLIEYVVTQGGGNVGDRSYSIRMLGNRKPDAEYYVTHQLLPAVMKILAEFGIDDIYDKSGYPTGAQVFRD